MYSFDSRVRYSETDYRKMMTPASIINYFQDCSTFHSEDVGVGISYWNKIHRAWIMCSWQLEINRFPSVNEKITVGTWAYEFKSMYGYRNFILLDEQKNVAAVANSIWVLMDTEQHHPARIQDSDTFAYVLEPPYPMEYCDRKLHIPKSLISASPFVVTTSLLDMFHHVNNSQYIRLAQDYVPAEFQIKQVRADYRKSALLGDTIYPLLHIEDSQITVVLADEQKHPYVIVSFKS
ncbi:MAG: thioesterase [Clostridiales bacterium]|nr:thioesterase [Clostridiales bacterium]